MFEAAGTETVRVFRAAGVKVSVTICFRQETGNPELCRVSPNAKQFLILNAVRRASHSSGAELCGQAFLGEDGFGRYADLFLDRIEIIHKLHGIVVRQLLGAVAAHEAGHLLLGFGAHSFTGIMKPFWESEDFRQVGMGALVFTPQQARLIQSRLN